MPDDSTKPKEGAQPAGTPPSGSPPRLPSTGGTSKEDSGKPEDGESPGERLMREAEAAGLLPSIDVIKGVLKGDQSAYEKLRAMIKSRTGQDARFLPSTRQSPKEAARARIQSRMAA